MLLYVCKFTVSLPRSLKPFSKMSVNTSIVYKNQDITGMYKNQHVVNEKMVNMLSDC